MIRPHVIELDCEAAVITTTVRTQLWNGFVGDGKVDRTSDMNNGNVNKRTFGVNLVYSLPNAQKITFIYPIHHIIKTDGNSSFPHHHPQKIWISLSFSPFSPCRTNTTFSPIFIPPTFILFIAAAEPDPTEFNGSS
mmetsp:Transcript_24722/g.60729  ORF Transcript_24722/g.60729 Transcript_24722/m.60729 type:complete len:136 (+) Transcript_24722:1627-2034(+)